MAVGRFNPLQAYAYRRLLEEPRVYDAVHPGEMSYDYGRKPALTEAELLPEHLEYLRAVADYDSAKHLYYNPKMMAAPSKIGGVNYTYYNPHIWGNTDTNTFRHKTGDRLPIQDLSKVGYDMASRADQMKLNRFGRFPSTGSNVLERQHKKTAKLRGHLNDPVMQLRYTFGAMDYEETHTQYIYKDKYDFNRYLFKRYLEFAKDEEGNVIRDKNGTQMLKYVGIENSPLISGEELYQTGELERPITAERLREMLALHGWDTEKKAPNNLEFGIQFFTGGGLTNPSQPLHLLGALYSPEEGYPVRIAVDKHPIHSVPGHEKKRRALDEISMRGLL